MEVIANGISSYQPVDLNTIPLPKVVTEKELENEVGKICEVLKDIRKD